MPGLYVFVVTLRLKIRFHALNPSVDRDASCPFIFFFFLPEQYSTLMNCCLVGGARLVAGGVGWEVRPCPNLPANSRRQISGKRSGRTIQRNHDNPIMLTSQTPTNLCFVCKRAASRLRTSSAWSDWRIILLSPWSVFQHADRHTDPLTRLPADLRTRRPTLSIISPDPTHRHTNPPFHSASSHQIHQPIVPPFKTPRISPPANLPSLHQHTLVVTFLSLHYSK